jgi:tripartite-type tricarboxylate transporter receptor subunit TctC
MNGSPRLTIAASGVIAGAVLAPAALHAQPKFPAKPIRLVVAFTPGGTTDILARMVTQGMSETFRQPIVIENRPGGGGVLAASIVAKAPPDGYTILATSAALLISAATSGNAPYNPLKDFAGVGELGYSTTVLVVTPSLGVKSVKELVALASTKPVKLLFGSVGAGSSTHLSGERFRAAAGFKAQHIGFKGQSEFLIEIIAGRIHFGSSGLMVSLPFIQEGKLIALAVGTAERSPVLPDVPAAPEVVPGWGRDGSQAWLAPAGTPRAVRRQISEELGRQLAIPEIKARLTNMGFNVAHTMPEEHEKNMRTDLEVFNRLALEAGLKSK